MNQPSTNFDMRIKLRSTPYRSTLVYMLTLAVTANGCVDIPGEPTQVVSSTQNMARDLSPSYGDRTGESHFSQLSRVAPTAAGFYYDEDANLIVRVKNPADDGVSISWVRQLLREHPGFAPGMGKSVRTVRIERAKYSFAELSALRDQITDLVLGKIDGIAAVDLDERENRVAIIANIKKPSALTEARKALAGASADLEMVVWRSKSGDEYREDFAPPATLQSFSTDPLAGGLQIVRNGSSACTLGFVASRDGVLGFVTASHCTSNFLGSDNSQFTQTGSSVVVGQEAVDAAPYACSYPIIYQCRGSDASFIASTSAVPMAIGKILRTTGYGSLTIDSNRPYFTVTDAQDDVLLGQIVDKVGRTTGWSSGYVNGTCVDFVQFSGGVAHQIRCAGQATYPADAGDSGGPIFIRLPGHPEIQGSELPGAPFWTDEFVSLVGTHSGRAFGDKYFSKLGRIKSDLGGSWVLSVPYPPPPPAALSAYITGSSDVLTSPTCNLRYVVNATGGAWNTYSYSISTSGTIKYLSGREVIIAFSTSGSNYVSASVSDANGGFTTSTLDIYASASGMDCNTI